MKILNKGLSNIIVKDKRGCEVILEPNRSVEVTDNIGKKLSRYSFIKVLQEKKEVAEVQQEAKEEKIEEVKEKVEVKTKKRKK